MCIRDSYYVIDLNKLEFKYSSMRSKYHSVNNLKVSEELLLFVNNELFNGTDISPEKFWEDFDKAVHELAPKNKELIDFRETLQKKIDKWHIDNKGKNIQIKEYKNFAFTCQWKRVSNYNWPSL